MSSSPEAYNFANEALGSRVEFEYEEAKAIPDISDTQSIHQYPHLLFHVSTASSNASDCHSSNAHSTISTLNPVDEEHMTDQDHMRKIKELHVSIDTVGKIVKPGCSEEVLEVALSSMSYLVEILYRMSSNQKLQSSL